MRVSQTVFTLYYRLFYPYLSYCHIVWASTFLTTLYKIFLQIRFVRIATQSESHPICSFISKTIYVSQICVFIRAVKVNMLITH